MLKKIGTLALLYGFFLSSASFTPVEEGVVAKMSYGERQVSGMIGKETLETCLMKAKADRPGPSAEKMKKECEKRSQ